MQGRERGEMPRYLWRGTVLAEREDGFGPLVTHTPPPDFSVGSGCVTCRLRVDYWECTTVLYDALHSSTGLCTGHY
jgi:hypothetical protein